MWSVFQITFKGRVPTRSFDGSIDASLPTSSQVYHLFSWGGGGVTAYDGLYGEALPKKGTIFRLEVYKRVGISQAEV